MMIRPQKSVMCCGRLLRFSMPAYSEEMMHLAARPQAELAAGMRTAELFNRLCGDHIIVGVTDERGRIGQVGWNAEGCAVLKASAAYLSQTLSGKTLAEAGEMASRFAASFEKANEFNAGPLAGVYALPARHKCALLPWLAFENLLRDLER